MSKKPGTLDFNPTSIYNPGIDSDMNAAVGDNGTTFSFLEYGWGFFDGGRAILAAARDGDVSIDAVIYPAAFTFRHGIELYLKGFLYEMIAFTKSDLIPKKNHKLADYMQMIRVLLDGCTAKIADKSDIDAVFAIIKSFDRMDPTGQVFRYPEDNKGNLHLKGFNFINAEALDQAMTVVREALEAWFINLNEAQRRVKD